MFGGRTTWSRDELGSYEEVDAVSCLSILLVAVRVTGGPIKSCLRLSLSLAADEGDASENDSARRRRRTLSANRPRVPGAGTIEDARLDCALCERVHYDTYTL